MLATDRTKPVPPKKRKSDRERVELRADPEWIATMIQYADDCGLTVSALIRIAVNKYINENPSQRNPKPQPRK